MVSLTPPPRRSLVDDLVRPSGTGAAPSIPRLDADRPDVEVAEFLAGIAHADTGFIARTDDGERAVAVIAATAAALCGEDIAAALTRPDADFLRGLEPPAVTALRDVLLAVETESPETVATALGVLAG